jgi:hypothetical protein
LDNDTRLVVDEVVGANASRFIIDFQNVDDGYAYTVNINGYYDGNPAHNVIAEIYNFNTALWEGITGAADDFPDRATDDDYAFALPDPITNYLDSGNLRIRFDHTSNGSNNHYFRLDRIYLTR